MTASGDKQQTALNGMQRRQSRTPALKIEKQFERLLDSEGRLTSWPIRKWNLKVRILEYLASKFEIDTAYKEKDVNEILGQYHTFNDSALLRRYLCDYGFLERTINGALYWKEGSSRIWLASIIYGEEYV